ncbi:MAG: hypothetical protein SFY66_26275 [Oculatellaceae cyanobacterium bins.114]|nr:hypothetical protein [Oculatellaceae cyanobacterium bins.114]
MKILAIIINIFFPGIGTLIVGKIAQGIIQIILDLVVFLLLFIPIIGWLIAVPIAIGNWIWALVSVLSAGDNKTR